MNRFYRSGTLGGLACAALAITLIYSGTSNSQTKEQASTTAAGPGAGKLIVHEWGTFTSFSGSNGAQLDFRPLTTEDLPGFVYDRQMQAGVPNFTKGRYRARIRMETPVTYFYTDQERTVTAQVGFPEGLLTEFYPPVKTMAPSWKESKYGREPLGNSKLDWGEIHLIPPASLAPMVKDDQTRDWLAELVQQRVLVKEANAKNHYYHARETDSAYVHVRRVVKLNETVSQTENYLEKFLFYRGLGRFDQPLKATVTESGLVQVTNSGEQAIHSLFQVTVSGESITVSELKQVAAGATVEFPVSQEPTTLADLQEHVTDALIAEQLYPREAEAMVKTWSDSWFAEEGTRVFYIVPRETTDAVLPLTISPAPDETVRVLVGRIEVMSPSVEQRLLEVVRLHALERSSLREAEEAQGNQVHVPLAIPAEFKKLGRLAEPALLRIRELARDNAIAQEAAVLLHECRQALDKGGQILGANVEGEQ